MHFGALSLFAQSLQHALRANQLGGAAVAASLPLGNTMDELLKVWKDGDFAIIEQEQKQAFLDSGWSLKETAKPKRARKSDGTLQADNPETPNINEAWEGGIAPKPLKRGRTRKS
jgi:hypothetical protein